MGLFRLILIIAIAAAGYWLFRRITRPARPKTKANAAKPMVRCAHCNLYLPQEQALEQNSRWYCSKKHLEQGPKSGDH
ncbi:MAG: hypothetical protein CMK72_18225 [Pseudomonadaceae bacterium]|nr:hypothetical protein [Pseudomonadaceae bacterium]HCP53330.1 hypothetical protein [Pseudomonas sp.]|tara:strand:+ start:325 stop:558 length:234 start_codon:yes stop_codon:yes gene_type:complete